MSTTRLTPTTAPPEPITLAEANAHLRNTCTDEDAYVTMLIAVARAEAENRMQRTLVPSTWRLALDAFPCGAEPVWLLMPPAVSVGSVTYWQADGTQATMAPSAYLLDSISEPARLVPAPGTRWPTGLQQRPGAVVVTYTAGYATPAHVPLPIKQWMLLAIGDMYANRERSADRPAVPQHFADSLLDVYRIWTI